MEPSATTTTHISTSTDRVMWLPRDLIFASQDWPLVLRKRRTAAKRHAPAPPSPSCCATPRASAGWFAPRLP
jgi:hypothetical protein